MNALHEIPSFYVAGGALRPGSPSYIKRDADNELLKHILGGKFCYVLNPRQTGKTSLMAHTVECLKESMVSSAVLDLTQIGTAGINEWYLGLLTSLQSRLKLTVDLIDWWEKHPTLSAVQRFTDFMLQVVLTQIPGQVVVFIDEIDSTIKLPFRDEFFAAIRSMYDTRPIVRAFDRLTFVVLGVATPKDLMEKSENRPFEVGQAIGLHDFSPEEAQPLLVGLDRVSHEKAKPLFERILYWTGGHPYLTQKLCEIMLSVPVQHWNADSVDSEVGKLVSGVPHTEVNLQTVRDYISGSPQRSKLISIYKKVHKGQPVPEDKKSTEQSYLILYGLVRAENGFLHVRNELYRRVFDDKWISKYTPKN